jgi:hypothetical protein
MGVDRRPPLAPRALTWLLLAAALGCVEANPAYRPLGDGGGGDARDTNVAGDGFGASTRGCPSGGVQPGSVDLRTGLVGHWDMDQAVGDTVVRDRSGRGHDGVLESTAGATWVTGCRGRALRVADSSPNVGVAVPRAAADGLRAYTLSAWLHRAESRADNYSTIISRQIGSGNGEVFSLLVVRDQLRTYAPPAADGFIAHVTAPGTLPLDVWIHAAATFDGQQLRLYLNGAQVGSRAQPVALPATTTPVYIATNKNANGYNEPFNGTLDDVLLYSVALPPAAIAALAAGAVPPAP